MKFASYLGILEKCWTMNQIGGVESIIQEVLDDCLNYWDSMSCLLQLVEVRG